MKSDARYTAESKGIEVYKVASELPSNIADLVISNHALEHTLNPLGELCELRRSLKSDGKLVMWLPLDDWRRHRDSTKADFSADVNHHLYTWTPLDFSNLLTEAGFQPLRVRVVSHTWPKGTKYLYRWLPKSVFNTIAYLAALATRKHQIMAIARPRV